MMKRICIFFTLFWGLAGCVNTTYPDIRIQHSENPFGLFVIHLTLIDYESQEPVPGLFIKALNINVSQLDEDIISDEFGNIRVSLVSAPPIPQEFSLSSIDADNDRPFSNDRIIVRFSNPVFVYNPKDAIMLGKWYQGTAELSLTNELRRIIYE